MVALPSLNPSLSALDPEACELARAMFRDEKNPCALTREQLADRIQALNPTASMEYLIGFSEEALSRYLDHLTTASEPRGREARWSRPGDTRAILRFVPAEGD